MSEQLHITHRDEYLRGKRDGYGAALCRYRPRDAAVGTVDQQHAYSLGYGDGYAIGIEETSGEEERACACTSQRFCLACYERACAGS